MKEELIKNRLTNSLVVDNNKIKNINEITEIVLNKFKRDKNYLNGLSHRDIEIMYDVLSKCLVSLSELTIILDEFKGHIKDQYTIKYHKNSDMGRRLFYKHYFEIHKPYDKLKSKIWKTMSDLDEYSKNNF